MDAVGTSSTAGAKYECLIFDMDDTLYPMSSGLNLACRKNIQEFMLRHLQIEESEVPKMCGELYREYGTTMAGLKAFGYEFDNDEFHAYVHGRLPYDVLKPDLLLRNLLLSMPQRKIIFTNADKAHAAQVLHRLGLEDCFEGIICFETLNPHIERVGSMAAPDNTLPAGDGNGISSKSKILCKPSVEAIEAAIQIANVDPSTTVGSTVPAPGADHALSSIHNIKEALPEIWDGEERKQLEQVIQPTSVETVILA